MEVVPSLLSANFANLAEDIKKVESIGCSRLHIDVMDGHFVPNITIGPVVIKSIRKITRSHLQTHLMIDQPGKYIKDFIDAGSDTIIIHQEACPEIGETIKEIKKLGVKAGVSIKPKTPVETLKDIIQDLDLIMIMSVEPGFGGQSYILGSEKKISESKALLEEKGLNLPIGVDGGINAQNAPLVAKAGATHLIAGNAVFKGDILENIKSLYRSINQL
ncbi:MAG: ribulose-phosphate 3-epimerase [Candidatus Omnitrophica bacterium]|nr:ribulose-phosphate 3-epimerase [Candidatus Omnitrophota bacterium]MBU1091037.1 ribulose-phosphate 3-epimerase [Candidatus Omnitrophota bacterium]MBU1906466.1 ribulose-phosphate 3-epimerase [Candidatus Omnitrophota bacterium]